jgi:hypothetical protein
MSVSVKLASKYRSFRAEEKEYKTGEKSKVDTFSPDNVEAVKDFIELAFSGKLDVPEKKPKRKQEAPASGAEAEQLEEEAVSE